MGLAVGYKAVGVQGSGLRDLGVCGSDLDFGVAAFVVFLLGCRVEGLQNLEIRAPIPKPLPFSTPKPITPLNP